MTKTVMIVEDNDLNLRLFEDILASEGYDTVSAVDGANALPLARRTLPDLILMDIHLPDESGLSATRRLKSDAELSDIPVIAVTAHAMTGDEGRIRAEGCADYISKPISVGLFLNKVRSHLH